MSIDSCPPQLLGKGSSQVKKASEKASDVLRSGRPGVGAGGVASAEDGAGKK